MRLEISDEDLSAFLSCFALGALHALRAGVPQAGGSLGTLSSPKMVVPLLSKSTLLENVMDIIASAEELVVLQDHYPRDRLDALMQHRIDRLNTELAKGNPNRFWEMHWLPESEYTPWEIAELLNRPGPLWLVGAKLGGTNLRGASLQGANLHRADLAAARLSHADLSSADLREANLIGANLSRSILIGARLRRARLRRASLAAANLSGADLHGVGLEHADLKDANLSDADLSRARLTGANLRGADLSGANLRQANLSGATVDAAQLADADTDGAVLPDAT